MSAIRNPFLVGRCVFFVFGVIINIITFISATIHIGVLRSHGLHVPGAPVFVIINSCALFIMSFFAFAELFVGNAHTAQIKFECIWASLLSIMQLAASIDITVNGPPVFCRGEPLNGAVCASSSILVPTTWLAAFFLLSYCLLLISVTIAHCRHQPAIWSASVYGVPWFRPKNTAQLILPSHSKDLPPLPRASRASTSNLPIARTFMARSDPEKQASSDHGPTAFYNLGQNETFDRPTWAKRYETRRGVDSPFFIHRKEDRDEQEVMSLSDAASSRSNGSRFVELGLREPKPTARVDRKNEAKKPSFPHNVYNPDEPIPLPHRSQWVRADRYRTGTSRTTSTSEK